MAPRQLTQEDTSYRTLEQLTEEQLESLCTFCAVICLQGPQQIEADHTCCLMLTHEYLQACLDTP